MQVMNRELYIFLHAFTFHCLIVFCLSHSHHSPPMTHRDSLYFVIICPPFLPDPILLCLSHIPVQSLLFLKSLRTRSEEDTVCFSVYWTYKFTLIPILSPLCKNVNMIRTQIKNGHGWYQGVRKTQQDAGSDHLNRDQSNVSPCLTPVAPAAHSDKGSLLPP